MKTQLLNLCYMAEEYKYYGYDEYKEVYDYLSDLLENIDNIEDEEIKKYLINWKYKDLVYKTLHFNSLWIPANDKIFLNTLNLLRIREYTKYEQFSNESLKLHINFKDSEFSELYISELQKLDKLKIFAEKYIHIFEGKYFEGEIFEYLSKNNYNIIYEIDNIEQIQCGTYNIRYCVDENNINLLSSIIHKHTSNNGEKCFIHIKKETSSEFRNNARKQIEELLFTYSSKKYSLIIEDLLPTQNIEIGFRDELSLKDNIYNLCCTTYKSSEKIEDIITTWKKELIYHLYINDKCINCEEKILCMLGVSDIECNVKIL